MIIFRLSTHSGVPLYLQIVQQVRRAVHVGSLKEGDKLPTIKEAVTMTAANPNTIARAYRELEILGLAEGRAGIGTFICRQPLHPPPIVQEELASKLMGWLEEAKEAGLSDELIESLMHTTFGNIRKDTP